MMIAILCRLSVSGTEPPRSIHIDRSDNPYRGLTSTAAMEDEGERGLITARELSADEYTFFPNLTEYRIDNRALFGRSRSGKFIAVEKRFFSDCKRADVTRLDKDSVIVIGNIDPAALKEMGLKKCAFFLLESQIINTYWHIGSDLELVQEKRDGNIYSARFKGMHVYYTNRKNTGALDFYIIINTATGEMSVRGN
jgi:hypothetical protein